jgi:RpiR family carbohydrate utilization transcriptional regulator
MRQVVRLVVSALNFSELAVIPHINKLDIATRIILGCCNSIKSWKKAVMPQTGSISMLIRKKIGLLSKSEVTVAKWILANEDRVASMSMGQVANECKLSDTSVLRLCRRIGMQGFTDLKFRIVADKARHAASKESILTRPLHGGAGIAKTLFEECADGLKSTLDEIGNSLDCATDIIESASEILIVGVGTSIPTVLATQEQLFLCGLKCRAQTDPYLQRMELALLESTAVVVAISHSGASIDSVEVLSRAKNKGLSTICVTGMPGSPLTLHSDVTLSALSPEIRNEPIAGRVVQFALVSALARSYASRHPQKAYTAERAAYGSVIEKTL